MFNFCRSLVVIVKPLQLLLRNLTLILQILSGSFKKGNLLRVVTNIFLSQLVAHDGFFLNLQFIKCGFGLRLLFVDSYRNSSVNFCAGKFFQQSRFFFDAGVQEIRKTILRKHYCA